MARPDPHKWIGAFRASLNEIVASGYSSQAQAMGMIILRRAHELDHGVGPGWEEAMEMSSAAGFAAGMEFMLDQGIAFPPSLFTKLRSCQQLSWPEKLLKPDVVVPVFLVSSPSGAHPPHVPSQLVRANHAVMQRLHCAASMPIVSWKEMHGLAINGNTGLAFALMKGARVEPLASPSSINHMLQIVRSARSIFKLDQLMIAVQAPSNWKPANFPEAVFAAWWSQAPSLAKRGDGGCATVLGLVGSALAPNDYPPLSNQAGLPPLRSALLLLERSGYSAQQIFRVAAHALKPSLPTLAITQNEPETLSWLVDQGFDLSGNNFCVDRFSSSTAARGLPSHCFWSAIIARIDLTARRADRIAGAPEQLDRWWACVHGLLQNPAANLAFRTSLRNAKVAFGSEDIQSRWESVISHVSLQRAVTAVPEPPADPPRPSARF